MTLKFKQILAGAGLVFLALASQPVLADGWHHHGYGGYRGGGWVPFAIGAVVGGIAVSAMTPPQPVYVQPAYAQPPVYVRPRVMAPPPVIVVPQPPPVYYSY